MFDWLLIENIIFFSLIINIQISTRHKNYIKNKIRIRDQILETKRTSTKVCSHQKKKKRVRKETVEIYY
jgi:rhamnogalacturonyl hydrolase YesR